MALGVIPPLCATLGPVLAGPEGCSRGRWRSGPSKWRHTAAPEGRGQGAPRTCRCIETEEALTSMALETASQGAPRTCRCIETVMADIFSLRKNMSGMASNHQDDFMSLYLNFVSLINISNASRVSSKSARWMLLMEFLASFQTCSMGFLSGL